MANNLNSGIWNTIKREGKQLKMVAYRSFYMRPKLKEDITNNFHRMYYDSLLFGETHGNTYWLGTQIFKCPMDTWIYQELVYETRPDAIIETGTKEGGSALFLASMCDLVKHGRVISIDIDHKEERPLHERITYLHGSSTSDVIVEKVRELIDGCDTIMVVLDSDHSKQHVYQELKIFCEFVTVGSYLVVEDTNMNGNPVAPEFGPGPMEAVEEFLNDNGSFEVDKNKEKFYLTFNPNGYLKKIK